MINFRWSFVQREDEKEIAKANLIKSLQNQAVEDILPKNTGGLFDQIKISYWIMKKCQTLLHPVSFFLNT